MPLGTLLSSFSSSGSTPLDDGSWLPGAQTHPVPEDDGPALDLAVQARLRRERATRGEDASKVVCLGPRPMGRLGVGLWALVFLTLGSGLLAAAVWKLGGGFHTGWTCGGLTGLLAAALAARGLLGVTNPRLSLRCDRSTFEPGSVAVVRWRFSRPPRRVRGFTVTLLGEERATYRQGTSDRTSTETFHEEGLVERPAGAGPPPVEGSFELAIPAGAMHSFEAADNAIQWRLRAHAKIAFWPDVRRDAPLRVWAGPEPEPVVEERL